MKTLHIQLDESTVLDIDLPERFEFRLDNKSAYWTNYQAQNQVFVTMMQRVFSDRLEAYGRVLLNEVLHSLDIPQVSYGLLLGWERGDTFEIRIKEAYTHGMVSTGFILDITPVRIPLSGF